MHQSGYSGIGEAARKSVDLNGDGAGLRFNDGPFDGVGRADRRTCSDDWEDEDRQDSTTCARAVNDRSSVTGDQRAFHAFAGFCQRGSSKQATSVPGHAYL
jgi:hypothetical protein